MGVGGWGTVHKKAGETAGPREKQGPQSWLVSKNRFYTRKAVLWPFGRPRRRGSLRPQVGTAAVLGNCKRALFCFVLFFS